MCVVIDNQYAMQYAQRARNVLCLVCDFSVSSSRVNEGDESSLKRKGALFINSHYMVNTTNNTNIEANN